jgi:hypothetical protein
MSPSKNKPLELKCRENVLEIAIFDLQRLKLSRQRFYFELLSSREKSCVASTDPLTM